MTNIKCGIYKITNTINGKIYIGQSTNIDIRKQHYFNRHKIHNEHLQNSFKKYGKDKFTFEVVKCCKEKYLDRFEKLYIRVYDTMNPEKGYNKESGGHSNKHLSDETRKKMSECQKGHKNSFFGEKHKKESTMVMSKQKNTTGFYRVTKRASKKAAQGYLYEYRYYDDFGKRHSITSVDIKNVEKKVKEQNLIWEIIDEEKAEETLSINDKNIEENKYNKSKKRNKTGFYRVYLHKDPSCSQGFLYVYKYYDNGQTKRIRSVDIKKLEKKVKDKGLEWIKF